MEQINLVDQSFSLPQKIRRKIFYNKVPKERFKVIQDPLTGQYKETYVECVYYRPNKIYEYVQSFIEHEQDLKVRRDMFDLGLKPDLSNYFEISELYKKVSRQRARSISREKFNKYIQKINSKRNITIND